MSAQRGEAKQASIEIIINESEPLEIVRVDSPSAQFTTELETITEGKHFRSEPNDEPVCTGGQGNRNDHARYLQQRAAVYRRSGEHVDQGAGIFIPGHAGFWSDRDLGIEGEASVGAPFFRTP